MSHVSAGYAAGFFDGEGTVNYRCVHRTESRIKPEQIRRPGRKVDYYEWVIKLAISNTHRGVLTLIQSRWGGTLHQQGDDPRNRPNRRPIFQWVIVSIGAEAFAKDIFPHLIVRRRQVELFLEFRTTLNKLGQKGIPPEILAKRLDIGREIIQLNSRGLVPASPTPLIKEHRLRC